VSEQVPGGDVGASSARGPGLTYIRNDGTDFRRSYDDFRRATELCRSGRGPVMVHSKVLRLYSHSSTDDMRKYRPREDVTIEFEERDPIFKFARELVEYGIASPAELQEIHARSTPTSSRPSTRCSTSQDRRVALPVDDLRVRSAEGPGRVRRGDEGAQEPERRQAARHGRRDQRDAERPDGGPARDRHVGRGRRRSLKEHFCRTELEGKGGVFGITKGLQRKYGPTASATRRSPRRRSSAARRDGRSRASCRSSRSSSATT
jgi:hypothetical protein